MSYRGSTLVLAAVVVATCAGARATAIVFDANSSIGNTVDPEWSHTVGAGSDRILIVGVMYEGPDPNLTSITYGGVALTFACSQSTVPGPNMNTTSLYYLLNPATGDANIAIDQQTDVPNFAAGGISLANVKQQGPEATAGSIVGKVNTITTEITTLTDGAWVVDVAGSGSSPVWDPNVAGQVERYEETAVSSGAAGSTKLVASAGVTTMGWDIDWSADSASLRMSHALAAFAPVSESVTLGDVNGDGNVDNLDITPFIYALVEGESAFDAQYPLGEYWAADCKTDGNIDNLDITPFVKAITGGGEAVPEPATLALLAVGGVAVLLRRRSAQVIRRRRS